VSIKWIGHVWERSPYKGEKLLIHLALADFANDEGYCFPSQKTLAKKARCTDTYVRLVIKEMVKSGFVEQVERGNGRGNSSAYVLKGVTTKEALVNEPLEKGGTTEAERSKLTTSLTIYKNRKEPSIYAEEFETFWKAYPRKVGKGIARNAFLKIREQESAAPPLDILLKAVELYKRSVTDVKYFCHPTTWLRQERWNDELEVEPIKETTKREEDVKYSGSLNLAGAYVLTGQTEEDLVDSLSHRPTDEINAALRFFRERKGIRTPTKEA